jgi:GNAT superfamily N-acetyltransferase
MRRHLAQLNIATLRYPLDDTRIADFVNALPSVNAAGEQSPGYVWRLQSDSGNATDIRVFDDPMVIVNLTLWESLDTLKTFAYQGIHRDFFRRRAEWFVPGSTRTALWWTPAGFLPTTDDAKRRLDFLDVFGASPYAFDMGQSHPALVIEHISSDDVGAVSDGSVVAELDDQTAGSGDYRLLDETTAEIDRICVAEGARGIRVGAAIVAELEAVARANGVQRLLLETSTHMANLYEKFGYRFRNGTEHAGSMAPTLMEKMLAA